MISWTREQWTAYIEPLAQVQVSQDEKQSIVETIAQQLVTDLQMVETNQVPSMCALACPRNKSSMNKKVGKSASKSIASRLFQLLPPDDHKLDKPIDEDKQMLWARVRYAQVISRISKVLIDQLQKQEQERLEKISMTHVHQSKLKYCLLKQRPISDEVKQPMPMPVVQSALTDFEPFFEFLRNNQYPFTGKSSGQQFDSKDQVEFKRGVFYSDGRMDLCKQVVGPDCIAALMTSLAQSQLVHHFLLGNNIIGPEGAKCIARYIQQTDPHFYRIETWYLAGNMVDGPSVQLILNALQDNPVNSSVTRAMWLKRNPLCLSGAKAMSSFLQHTSCHLRILDLDNTGLLDQGVEQLMIGLKQNDTVRHLYLNGNGIGPQGAQSIASYFDSLSSSQKKGLRSLFLSVNQIGDEGIEAIGRSLQSNGHLKRLIVSSNQIESNGVEAFVQALRSNPNCCLEALDLGIYASTGDLGALPNRIEDQGAKTLADWLASGTCPLKVLSVAHNGLTGKGFEYLHNALTQNSNGKLLHLEMIERKVERPTVLWNDIQDRLLHNIQQQYGPQMTRKDFYHREMLHRIRNIQASKHIVSVYRTRDFARPNRKNVVKRWTDKPSVQPKEQQKQQIDTLIDP